MIPKHLRLIAWEPAGPIHIWTMWLNILLQRWRTKKGVVFEDFTKKLKNDFWDVYALQRAEFEMFVREGYAESDVWHIALTRKGIDISNRIMSLFV